MSRMRASPGVFEEIWALPYLLQAIRIRGQASWSCKVELVAGIWPLVIGKMKNQTGSYASYP
jgi:hypothetical protein